MAKTLVSDVITPSIFVPYVIERSTELSRLWQSGIVGTSADLQQRASGGGNTINMPYWNALSGASEELSDSSSLTPAKVTAEQDVAVKHLRGKAWEWNDLAGTLAGDDPGRVVADRVARFWAADYQKTVLIPSLTGIFATALSSTHVNDVAIEDGDNAAAANLISSDTLIDTAHLLGDHWDMITAIAVHSVVFKKMQKDDIITFEPISEQNIEIPRFLGREVIVDDGLPTVAGGTSGTKYTSYLFAEGSVGYGDGGPAMDSDGPPFETDRDILAGDTIVVSRRHYYLHPRGVAWTGTAAGQTPTSTELETGGNWAKRYDDKNIGVLKLVTNG